MNIHKRISAALAAAFIINGFFMPVAFAAPTPTTLTITAPNGGEIWSGTHNITWSSVGGVFGDEVTLAWSTDNFVSNSNIIAENIPYSAGSYAWNTATVVDGANYRVRVIAESNNAAFGTSNANFTVDNTAPVISNVTVPNATMKIGDVVTATITVGSDAGVTYSLVSGAIDGFTLTNLLRVNPTTYTATFTVVSGGDDVAAGSDIPVANLILADIADVPNQSVAYATAISQGADPIDANVPILSSVSIASNNANTAFAKVGDTVTVSFTANEGLAEGANKPVVTIAGNSAVVSGSGAAWTATYVMAGGEVSGIILFTINFKDVALNIGAQVTDVTNGSSVTFDETAPTIPTANIIGTTIQAADDTIAITFDEPVIAADGTWSVNEVDGITGSVTGALTLTNASFGYSGNVLTITLNKTADGMYLQNGETITVDPAINKITDIAGNAVSDIAVAGSVAVDGDIAVPTVALTYSPNQTVYKAGNLVTVTATFNESVKSGTGKPQIAIATVGDGDVAATDMLIGANDMVWTYVWTVPMGSDDDGSAIFTITSTDLAGNANASATNESKLIDNTLPTLGIVVADNALKAGETSLVTFTFSEPVIGFDNTDITVENGMLDTVVTADGGITWTATFTPAVNVEDTTNMVSVGTALTDIAGNAPAASTDSNNYAIDTIRPTVSIGISDVALQTGDTSTLTFTFSELPTGFDVADIAAPNGALSGFTVTGDPLIYTALFTPTANIEDSTNVITVGIVWTDPAGNAPAASTDSANYAIDTKAPTIVSIILADADLKAGETSLVTITFSESVTNFDNTDVTTIENGTLTSVSSANGGSVWTATFTPTVDIEDATNIITVTLTGLTDIAGNAGSGSASSSNYVIDTLLPTLTTVSIGSNNAIPTLAKAGDVVTVTFTASEPIVSPTVIIQGVAATSVTNPAGNNWVATRTMTGTDTEGAVGFSIAFTDTPAGNNGVTVTATTNASSVLYDRTNPSVNAGTDKEVNAVVVQDATTSDGGSGIASRAWTQISGAGTVTFGTPATEDTTILANMDGTYVLRLTVIDMAGNSAFDEITFIWDTTNPEPLTAIPSNNATGIALAAGTVTVTYDEPIVLLDSSRILLVNDVTGTSYKGAVAVSGVNPAMLNIAYSGLDYGIKYRINVKPNALEDVAGNNLLTNFISYFTTIIDSVPPVINSLSAGSITTTGVTLSVTTNEGASCSYAATDSAYASMTAFDAPNTGTAHTVAITGLTSSTGYDYYVRCADTSTQVNTMTTSAHVSFTTAVADVMAPTITNIQTPSISQTGATVTWTTDEVATSRIEYGVTSAYGSFTTVDASADTISHSVAFTGLSAGTTYHFRVLSADAASNAGVSVDGTFTTVAPDPDTITPPVPSITTTSATVNADTYQIAGTAGADTPSVGTRIVTVYNGATIVGAVTVPVGQTGWSILIALTQDTANSFTVTSVDNAGNVSAASAAVVITEDGTLGVDVTAPDVPLITTLAATVDADTYEISGTEANDSDVRTVSLFVSSSVVGTAVLPAGQTAWTIIIPLTQSAANTITAKATDAVGNTSAASLSVIITEQAVVTDTTAPASPVITTVSATVDADNYVIVGTAADDGGVRTVRLYNGATLVATLSLAATQTAWSSSIALTQNATNTFTATSADEAGNVSAASVAVVITEAEGAATLATTGIDMVRSFATADNTFDNGWKWTFHVTAPTAETAFKMKFADFVSGANSISAATNIRFYSAQSSNATSSASAITVSAANTYSTEMTLISDLSAGTAGRQIDITVEARVPVTTTGGSYSTSYGIQSL